MKTGEEKKDGLKIADNTHFVRKARVESVSCSIFAGIKNVSRIGSADERNIYGFFIPCEKKAFSHSTA